VPEGTELPKPTTTGFLTVAAVAGAGVAGGGDAEVEVDVEPLSAVRVGLSAVVTVVEARPAAREPDPQAAETRTPRTATTRRMALRVRAAFTDAQYGTATVAFCRLELRSAASHRARMRPMRALVLRDFSGPAGVVLEEVAPPDDGGDDGRDDGRTARIEVHAAGVSFADLLITRGEYQLRPALPFVPGLEVAGVLRQAPPGTGFAAGDRVAAFMFGGAFAEEARADPATMVRLPEKLGFPEGAGLVVNYHTAWFALARRARLQPGETVLVQGAGGGLGVAVIQVARALGARVVGVAGTEAKAAMAEAAGADVVVTAGTGWADAVRAATGPVDVVVDPVGGDRFDDSLRLLRPEGRLVVVGFAGGDIPRVKVNRLLLRNVSVLGAAWREFLAGEPGFVAEAAAALDALIADGGLAPIVGAAYPLEDGVRALQDLAERRAVGKLVLTVR